MDASRAWPLRTTQEPVQVDPNGNLFGVAVGEPLHVKLLRDSLVRNYVAREDIQLTLDLAAAMPRDLIVAPRQTTQTSNKIR